MKSMSLIFCLLFSLAFINLPSIYAADESDGISQDIHLIAETMKKLSIFLPEFQQDFQEFLNNSQSVEQTLSSAYGYVSANYPSMIDDVSKALDLAQRFNQNVHSVSIAGQVFLYSASVLCIVGTCYLGGKGIYSLASLIKEKLNQSRRNQPLQRVHVYGENRGFFE